MFVDGATADVGGSWRTAVGAGGAYNVVPNGLLYRSAGCLRKMSPRYSTRQFGNIERSSVSAFWGTSGPTESVFRFLRSPNKNRPFSETPESLVRRIRSCFSFAT